MARPREVERGRIIGLREAGLGLREVARRTARGTDTIRHMTASAEGRDTVKAGRRQALTDREVWRLTASLALHTAQDQALADDKSVPVPDLSGMHQGIVCTSPTAPTRWSCIDIGEATKCPYSDTSPLSATSTPTASPKPNRRADRSKTSRHSKTRARLIADCQQGLSQHTFSNGMASLWGQAPEPCTELENLCIKPRMRSLPSLSRQFPYPR
ncbi:hypothetical protein PybrP1_002694 [[Pythium] brassicae (nom. inval.)]|nr:hypothetical protein PybrP1_002694 [[Pythium] brassicae (nom. inval.)]